MLDIRARIRVNADHTLAHGERQLLTFNLADFQRFSTIIDGDRSMIALPFHRVGREPKAGGGMRRLEAAS